MLNLLRNSLFGCVLLTPIIFLSFIAGMYSARMVWKKWCSSSTSQQVHAVVWVLATIFLWNISATLALAIGYGPYKTLYSLVLRGLFLIVMFPLLRRLFKRFVNKRDTENLAKSVIEALGFKGEK